MANEPDPAPSPNPSQVPVATIEHDNSQVEDFLEQHKSKLILAGVAVLVAVVAWVGIKFAKESGFSEAAGALTGAETIEELRGVIKEYPDIVVAGTASLFIIDQLQKEEKADEAYTALKDFVASHPDHPLYPKGLSDLGLQEHVKGDLEEAVSLLRKASTREAFIAHPALLRLGDAITAQGLEAMQNGDVETAKSLFSEAQVVYENLEERVGDDRDLGSVAKRRRERLPHLSLPPLSPEEAKAQVETTTPSNASGGGENNPAEPAAAELTPPSLELEEIELPEVSDSEGDAAEAAPPPLETLPPPTEATLPADDGGEGDDGN